MTECNIRCPNCRKKIELNQKYDFNNDELELLIHVLSNEIESGGCVSVARAYLKLIYKLEEMMERNRSK